MPIKAVFFDIDGTLVDSNDLHVEAWIEAFETIGVRIDRRVIRQQIGKGTDKLVPALLPDVDDRTIDALGKVHGTVFQARYLSQVQAFPRAHDLLARVHEDGKQVVLASSASRAERDYYTAFLDATDIVAHGTTADDVENTKPAPDIFAVALKKVAPLAPSEVIVVGDTPYDIKGAKRCGIAALGLLSGSFPEQDLRAAGAVAIYDDVAALFDGYTTSPLAG